MPRKAETPRKADRAKAAPAFKPFADEAAVETIGGLSIENGTSRIAVHGSLDLTRDQAGLERARRLKAALGRIVAALEAEPLPDAVAETVQTPRTVKNPFA